MEPPLLDASGMAELRSEILKKVFASESVLSGRFRGARGGWEVLVGRLVAEGDVGDGVVEFVAGDFRGRWVFGDARESG